MQLRRRRRAAAVAVAVIAGTLGATGTAVAAPPSPHTSAGKPEAESNAGLPAVWPRPQSIREADGAGDPVTVPDGVTLVVPPGSDPYAVDLLVKTLRGAGARDVRQVPSASDVPDGAGLVVHTGAAEPRDRTRVPAARDPRTGSLEATLRALGATARGDLPSGGYRLAAGRVQGRPVIAMEGVGADGLFHAAQTFRQLVDGREVAGVVVRDWPGTAVRGLTEGFYGTPWTTEQRLAQLDFMGRTKQNRYLYAPGDDLYRQARWRETYPAEQRAAFRRLAERARANHVTLGWAVAPGQAMCMSSDADVKALTRKLDAMWALGVRAFQLQFQDVSYSEWHCSADAKRFGSGPRAAARAQAEVANAVARHLADRHPGTALSLMPTEYFQDGATAYRTALAADLADGVEVAWTGVGVVPRTITGSELDRTRRAFSSSGGAHQLLTMDNYPVNDYAQDRIFLGPYTGREPAVASGSAAVLATAMEQPAASRIPLFTTADYAWNPRDYRPQESWKAAIDDLAGGDPGTEAALTALAGNDASSVLGADESAYLKPLLAEFWRARTTTDENRNARAAKELRGAFTVMRRTPQALGSTALDAEVRPWSDKLGRYGAAGESAVDMLDAAERGDGAAAWRASKRLAALREELRRSRVTVGKGVLDPFLDRAQRAFEAWAGTDRADAAHGTRAELPRRRALSTVTVLSEPGTGGTVEIHVPGEGWKRLGAVADDGFTELDARKTLADGIRVTGADGDAGRVERIVPWYADAPAASFSLARTEADAEIGGGAQRVTARLTSQRPGGVHGTVTAKAPHGIEVRTPKRSELPRGARVDVPVEVSVPAGTPAGVYEIPLTFGDETRTVAVRAFPRTAGPDLARAGKASASAEETADFPASGANDGAADTRWSSPAEDGAWWQVELAEPVRLGQVVLRWQDAYPAAYRVQTSGDGRTWRTAATVRDGRGGRESVRMDAKDTRFVRVVGDKRATKYGISLWSVEAYAVAPAH
ncbi:beta-N-acetylglucosaminidase domain-containing protein [Streptomyces xanthii]|uniref:Beta-N-acetylglucosaminidase domain-containing protein n=1 Tax=Streptomyces xanthii TaxID=2768069 RepID=A0A7H1BBX0_9ACTN|nr:beta-N-acetylglucosaminidase domain-containing protein [Streptomyces xanthii]QNS06225.1 beta-N-acetylglucosaminidase domain-containing protein [Streptomyces xanthii]